MKRPMQAILSTPSPCPLDQQVVPLGALLEHPFTNLAASQALLSPRTRCEVLRVSHSGLYGEAEEPRQGKDPGSEASPALHTWCPNRAWADLGEATGWGAVSRERIFTTETKTVFHHPNADERPKGIISQSVAWEVNRGYKPERALCTNKCNFCWLNQSVRPLDTERALDCARGTLVSVSF